MRTTTHGGKQPKPYWLMFAIILLGFGLRCYRLGYQSLWWDEAKTIERSLLALPAMMQDILAASDQVPFYFVAMKGWLQLGQSAFVVRSFSLFLGVISLALIYQLGRKAIHARVGLLAAFLLAVNPFHIWYSQEARMYTLLMGAILVAHLFLLLALKRDAWFYWVGYALAMLTAVYTHLFTFLIFTVHYIFFALHYRFLKRHFFKWLGYTAVVGGFFTIWGLIYLQTSNLQTATPPWIAGTGWHDPLLTLLSFSAGRTIDPAQPLYYLLPLIYFSAMIITVSRNRLSLPTEPLLPQSYQTFVLRLLLLWLTVPILLTFFISLNWPGRVRQVSIYTDRYLIIVLPALIILVAWGLHQLGEKKTWLLPITLSFITLGSLPSLYNNYFQPQYGREQWQLVAKRLTADSLPTDLIWSRNDHQIPLAYYLDRQPPSAKWIIAAPPEPGTDFEAGMAERVTIMAAEANRVWLVTQFYNNDLHGFPQQRNEEVLHTATADPQYAWMKAHLTTVADETFIGIRLTLFDLSSIVIVHSPRSTLRVE